MAVFSKFVHIGLPKQIACSATGRNPAFQVEFTADAEIPFPQIVIHGRGPSAYVKGKAIRLTSVTPEGWHYLASVPSDLVSEGQVTLQIEGCRTSDLSQAAGTDWIKEFRTLELSASPASGAAKQSLRVKRDAAVKIYFGIHKHMHQPYYKAADARFWDGEKTEIFGSRAGNYTDFIPAAVRQYIAAGLPHAGLSTSWSGSLIEQLDRCAAEQLCGDRFKDWRRPLRAIAGERTALGNPRVSFSAFGFFHPLMPLIPTRDIVRQIRWHREIVRDAFGVEASTVLFPPETAFHVRMIPALLDAGVTAVIYDSIHRYRACRDYPYGGIGEGMLPPNPAEQVNPPAADWLQLHGIWTGSKIAPSLLKPEYIAYEDSDQRVYKIIAVPAERYLGNEDARGGFGALQYPKVFGQLYDHIVASGGFDPAHPPFLLLHSDGDNHGGGADSYYRHNTAQLVRWLGKDPRFELTTVEDYLQRFPPDPTQAVHLEPGAWSGADNGDPQFLKWFGFADRPYSPDINSWAVLTALQNAVHTLEDSTPNAPRLEDAQRLLLTAETSCYWYWTGQEAWDKQVTEAANQAYRWIGSIVEGLRRTERDRTAPTLFPPWVTPLNPGGKEWGQGCLRDAPPIGTIHTLVSDISGLERVTLVLRSGGKETRLPMKNRGPYPSKTGAEITSDYLTAELPAHAGDLRYYIEAEDRCGNLTRSSLERLYVA